jgi:hypothetical protein
MSRSYSTHGGVEKYTRCFGFKTQKKRPLGRRRRRWEDNIRMDLREIVWENVDWMRLTQDRDDWQVFVFSVMTFGFHKRQGIS